MAWTMTGSAFASRTSAPLSIFHKLCSQRVQSMFAKHPMKNLSPTSLCHNSCFRFSDTSSNTSVYRTIFVINLASKNTLFRNVCKVFQRNSCIQGSNINTSSILVNFRTFSTSSRCYVNPGAPKRMTHKDKTVVIYILAAFIFMIGGAYAGVPLYKVFCQATGLGGQATKGHDTSKIEDMEVVDRQIKVRFNADTAASMRWSFRPQQYEIMVAPGETALAFYTAKNPTDKPIIGISTYNVLPVEAGQYFNKIQCFCFEEQRLNPKEQVDMPVFFYIDPEFAEDPKLETTEVITLSYTFFEAKEGLQLPLPGYPQPHNAA